MAVDPLFAQWLQSEADSVVRSDAAAIARWGATGITTERTTAIARSADAAVEADRELAFFARGPFAIDVHDVVGTDWLADVGRVVTFTSDLLDYDGGVDVMVTDVQVDRASGLSSVTVIRPLRGAA